MCEHYNFGDNPITCHAWNKDRSQLALSPNNDVVHIYRRGGPGEAWTLPCVLEQHNLHVTGIDWAPNTNRIVTCSADRNAYVWNQTDEGVWKPSLVLLRINRAATCVRWSPKENKFAVGSGAKLIAICYFEKGNNWWISKHIQKPIRSTVTCLDWHPNNWLLAAGTADFKVRVYSGLIKEIEETPTELTKWASKTALGTVVVEFSNSNLGGGWVRSVSFSEDGNRLCWVSHDASICLVDVNKGFVVHKFRTKHLPLLNCVWVGPNTIVVSGHGYCPMLYNVDETGSIQFGCELDVQRKKATVGISAMAKWQMKDKQGRLESADTILDSIHQNTITCMNIYQGSRYEASKVSTSGKDGQLVIWDLQLLQKSMAEMRIK